MVGDYWLIDDVLSKCVVYSVKYVGDFFSGVGCELWIRRKMRDSCVDVGLFVWCDGSEEVVWRYIKLCV